MWIRQLSAHSVLLFVLVNSVHAAVISTFDADAEGWIGTPGGGSCTWFASGGNSDGHIRCTDISGGPVASGANAPSKFLGDLSAFDNGSLSVDLATFGGSGATFPNFGRVRISSAGDTAFFDLAATAPARGTWPTFSAPLTAADWGKTSLEWMAILADVTEIVVQTDAFDGPDTIGIDNFTIMSQEAPIPEPGSLALVAGGAAVILFFGTRSRGNRTTPKPDGALRPRLDQWNAGKIALPDV